MKRAVLLWLTEEQIRGYASDVRAHDLTPVAAACESALASPAGREMWEGWQYRDREAYDDPARVAVHRERIKLAYPERWEEMRVLVVPVPEEDSK